MEKKPVSTVQIVKWSELSSQSLTKYFEKIGIAENISRANKIIIKPNLCAGSLMGPESGCVTNPDILILLVETIKGLNGDIFISIVESASIGRVFATDKFRFQKYTELFKHYERVECVDLSASKVAVYPCARLFFKDGIVLPKIFNDADFFISLGKMKTHINTVITGCLKNQFGCLPERKKDVYHPYLKKVIADINSAIPPDVCILEGVPAMEGNGPVFGNTKNIDVILISKDAVAIDSIASKIMGFKPEKISHIVIAGKIGLGTYLEKNIQINGVPVEHLKTKFEFVTKDQMFYINFGFLIQRLGNFLNYIGYRIHLVRGTFHLIGKALSKTREKTCNVFRPRAN